MCEHGFYFYFYFLLAVHPDHVVHVPGGGVAVLARVDQQHVPPHARQPAEGTQPRRAAADYDGVVCGLVVYGWRCESGAGKGCCCLGRGQEA